jgi:NADH:ubiquinone reductase (H+-translocating)
MDARPHVVIIGAGFGGLETARRLAKAPVRITLIDRNNYHLFQPLLYQVAIAGLSPVEIAYPVRAILNRQQNLSFLMGEVSAIDLEARRVAVDRETLAYDTLVVAVGGRTNFFGLASVEAHAMQLKDIASAVAARNRLLEAFEHACRVPEGELRHKLLTFVVVGGGPTGVKTAGALSELIRLVLTRDYPSLDLSEACVVLLEAGPALMPTFPVHLQAATKRMLQTKGVDVRLNVRVTGFDGDSVSLADGPALPAGTLIWTAGVRAAGLVDRLGVLQDASGRVRVEPALQLPGHPEVFVLGDAACLENGQRPLPMLATVALQEARSAAGNIARRAEGLPTIPFEYRDPGLLATIGRNAAVAYIGGVALQGFPAWLIWVVLHIFRIIGFRNRLVVMINWAWEYFFYYRAVRLITGE